MVGRSPRCYCSFAYSALACFRMGMPGSASFRREGNSYSRRLESQNRTLYPAKIKVLARSPPPGLPSCMSTRLRWKS